VIEGDNRVDVMEYKNVERILLFHRLHRFTSFRQLSVTFNRSCSPLYNLAGIGRTHGQPAHMQTRVVIRREYIMRTEMT